MCLFAVPTAICCNSEFLQRTHHDYQKSTLTIKKKIKAINKVVTSPIKKKYENKKSLSAMLMHSNWAR